MKERILVYRKVARIFRQILALYAESKQIHWMRSESLSRGAHTGALWLKKGVPVQNSATVYQSSCCFCPLPPLQSRQQRCCSCCLDRAPSTAPSYALWMKHIKFNNSSKKPFNSGKTILTVLLLLLSRSSAIHHPFGQNNHSITVWKKCSCCLGWARHNELMYRIAAPLVMSQTPARI